MRHVLLSFALLLMVASTATAAAPQVQFGSAPLKVYAGEIATIQAFLFGEWSGRYAFPVWATSDIVSVPSKVDSAGRTATFDVHAWKPGTTTIMAYSGAGRPSEFAVTVLGQDLSEISPIRASIAGGEDVTIRGMGFSPGCLVSFGFHAARNVTFVDRQTIVATTPPHAAGMADLRVVCGAHESIAVFEFVAPRRRTVGRRN